MGTGHEIWSTIMFPLEVGEGEEPPENINSILEMEVGAQGKLELCIDKIRGWVYKTKETLNHPLKGIMD